MMGQQPPPQTQQPGLQQQYIQQFPGQQVHGVITSQHQLNNSNQQRPQFQYSTQPQQQTNYQEMIPISQVQEMIPIPQVQPINTNVSTIALNSISRLNVRLVPALLNPVDILSVQLVKQGIDAGRTCKH